MRLHRLGTYFAFGAVCKCSLISPPPVGIVITPVCWFVRLLDGSLRLSRFLEKYKSPISLNLDKDVQHLSLISLQTLESSRSKFTVKTMHLQSS